MESGLWALMLFGVLPIMVVVGVFGIVLSKKYMKPKKHIQRKESGK